MEKELTEDLRVQLEERGELIRDLRQLRDYQAREVVGLREDNDRLVSERYEYPVQIMETKGASWPLNSS